MDFTPLLALLTAIMTAVAVHLKNLSQDSEVSRLKHRLDDMRKDIEKCESDRDALWAYLDDYDL